MYDFNKDLKKCLVLVSEKSGLGDSNSWTQRDFEQLSLLIEKETSIILSVSTLLRLWKGVFSKRPQKSTLNALAIYAGFSDWYNFTISNISPNSKKNIQVRSNSLFLNKKRPIIISCMAYLTICFASSFFQPQTYTSNKNSNKTNKSGYEISSNNKIGIPLTMQLENYLNELNQDSVMIKLNWKPDYNSKSNQNGGRFATIDIYKSQ